MVALIKALLTFVFLGLLMRAARALTGGGRRGPDPPREAGAAGEAEGAPRGAGPQTPVRREDIIDVPYEDG